MRVGQGFFNQNQDPDADPLFIYNVQFFSVDSLSPKEHTLVIHNGNFPETSFMILDSIVYTTGPDHRYYRHQHEVDSHGLGIKLVVNYFRETYDHDNKQPIIENRDKFSQYYSTLAKHDPDPELGHLSQYRYCHRCQCKPRYGSSKAKAKVSYWPDHRDRNRDIRGCGMCSIQPVLHPQTTQLSPRQDTESPVPVDRKQQTTEGTETFETRALPATLTSDEIRLIRQVITQDLTYSNWNITTATIDTGIES
ncbi:hypothetical protein C8J56DRAFT_895087 [Mycena floridula]|nr:hypothetical protein C8J56DRAFT_895087 [Mycena floridula]